MSEFSDSYHLRAESLEDGVGLLRAAGLRGYVFPPENGWVTVLPEGEPFDPNQALIAAAPGVLLHYVHAADHGWGFELYRGGKAVARYEAEWENSIRIPRDETDPAVLDELLGDGFRALTAEERRALLKPTDDELWTALLARDENNLRPPERFAEAVGLTNYFWLSFDYLEDDYDDEPEYAERGVVRVD
jgi:hypothetical protein